MTCMQSWCQMVPLTPSTIGLKQPLHWEVVPHGAFVAQGLVLGHRGLTGQWLKAPCTVEAVAVLTMHLLVVALTGWWRSTQVLAQPVRALQAGVAAILLPYFFLCIRGSHTSQPSTWRHLTLCVGNGVYVFCKSWI